LDHLPAIRYGRRNEHNAILKYEELTGFHVERSGLVVSIANGVLAASPDGLVGNEGLIEVKCPILLDGKDPENYASVYSKGAFLKRCKHTGAYEIVKSHPYYFQIIMTLHVTKKMWCDLVVWSSGPKILDSISNTLVAQDPKGMAIIIRINRDSGTESLFELMTTKLLKFWRFDLAPEIIDPRKINKKPFRQPEYRVQAMAEKQKKKSDKLQGFNDENRLHSIALSTVNISISASTTLPKPSSSSSTSLNFIPPPTYYADSEDSN